LNSPHRHIRKDQYFLCLGELSDYDLDADQ